MFVASEDVLTTQSFNHGVIYVKMLFAFNLKCFVPNNVRILPLITFINLVIFLPSLLTFELPFNCRL